MAKKLYIGVSNRSEAAQKVYFGSLENKARLVKKMYIGDENNKAKMFFSAEVWTKTIIPGLADSNGNKMSAATISNIRGDKHVEFLWDSTPNYSNIQLFVGYDKNYGSGGYFISLLKFPLEDVANADDIVSATLRINFDNEQASEYSETGEWVSYVHAYQDTPLDVTLGIPNNSWDADTVKFNDMLSGYSVVSEKTVSANGWYEWDVTDAVKRQKSGTIDNNGFALFESPPSIDNNAKSFQFTDNVRTIELVIKYIP